MCRALDERGLGRLEPYPDERNTRFHSDALDRFSVSSPRIHCIGDRAVTTADRALRPIDESLIHSRRHIRGVSLWAETLQGRDTTQALADLIATKSHCARRATDVG